MPLDYSRLVEDDERKWTDENVNNIGLKHFPNIDRNAALARPILYSNWLSKDYMPVEQEELRDFVKARLKVWMIWINLKVASSLAESTTEAAVCATALENNYSWKKMFVLSVTQAYSD